MATGIYRDPAAERAAAQAAARAAQQGVVNVSLPANQRPDYQYSVPTQAQVVAANMARGGAGLAGGGFWEGGDIYINPVTNQARPTNAALQNLREADPWANVNWAGLGQLLNNAGIPLQGARPGGGGTSTGGGGTSTGGGGGTSVPSFNIPAGAAAAAAPPVNQGLLDALAKLVAEEEARIKGAGTALQTALTGRDPMATYQWNPATVNIPQATLANYVQATGGSPAEVLATQQLGQELLNQSLADVGQFAEGARTAESTWRGRQQDVGSQLQADALRQLALNRLAVEMGIRMSEEDRKRQQEQQALALALQYGRPQASGSNLGITTPNLPFETVTLPGVGNVYIPSTLGGINF